jgi:hypothetical protein
MEYDVERAMDKDVERIMVLARDCEFVVGDSEAYLRCRQRLLDQAEKVADPDVYIVEVEYSAINEKGYVLIKSSSAIEARNIFLRHLTETNNILSVNFRVIGNSFSPFKLISE